MNVVKVIAICCISWFAHNLGFSQGMHPDVQIAKVKEQLKCKNERITNAYNQLVLKADNALKENNHALEDFSIPGRYINEELHVKNSQSLQIDAFNAYVCALAYRLNGDKKYGQKACELLNAWGSINRKFSDYDGVLVMAYSGAGLMNAALLMKKQKIWDDTNQKQFELWVKGVYKVSGDSIRTRKNNWGDWGRYASLLAASYLIDKNEIKANCKLIKSDLAAKITENGSMPEETKRKEKGIWYTYFSLAPITASAWIIYNETGEDLFHQNIKNASIKKALDYLLRYTNKPEEWPHFLNPEKPSLSNNLSGWPYNLFEAMGGIYGDKDFVEAADKYRPIIYSRHHFAWTFPTLMPCEWAGIKQK